MSLPSCGRGSEGEGETENLVVGLVSKRARFKVLEGKKHGVVDGQELRGLDTRMPCLSRPNSSTLLVSLYISRPP